MDKALEVALSLIADPPDWKHTIGDIICAYGAVDKNGGVTRPVKADICHARLCYDNKYAVLAGHKLNEPHAEFIDWVCSRSWYSHGVKNPREQWVRHGVVVDHDIGLRGVLWLAKAYRYCTEDTFRAVRWKTLVDLGCDPHAAFMVASMLDKTGTTKSESSHNSLFTYYGEEKFKDAYASFIQPGPVYNDTDATYGTIGWGWPKLCASNWLLPNAKTVRKPDGWGGFIEVPVPQSTTSIINAVHKVIEKEI